MVHTGNNSGNNKIDLRSRSTQLKRRVENRGTHSPVTTTTRPQSSPEGIQWSDWTGPGEGLEIVGIGISSFLGKFSEKALCRSLSACGLYIFIRIR